MSGCAWVTLATNDTYCLGALVLAHSLKRVSTRHQLAIIITPTVSPSMREQLSKVFNVVHLVDVLDSGDATNLALLQRPDLGITFTKIHCWNLTQFSKCVFLDADTLVMQNCDELMEREELSAAPDPGWPDCFNSGVFVFVPNLETFKQLVQFAVTHGSFDGGDQGLLNMYFNEWPTSDIRKHLSFLYNMCSTSTYTYLPALKYYGANIKIVHFIGANKPWLLGQSGAGLSTFTQAWWDTFQSSVVQDLNKDMTGLAGALGSKEKSIIEEQWRKQNWEQGNIDFTGKDSFENIWQTIMKAVNKPIAETPKPPQKKIEEKPVPKEIASQAIPEKEKADIPLSAEPQADEKPQEPKKVEEVNQSAPLPLAAPPTPVPQQEQKPDTPLITSEIPKSDKPIPMPPPTPEKEQGKPKLPEPPKAPAQAPVPETKPDSTVPLAEPQKQVVAPPANAGTVLTPTDKLKEQSSPSPLVPVPAQTQVLQQAPVMQQTPDKVGELKLDEAAQELSKMDDILKAMEQSVDQLKGEVKGIAPVPVETLKGSDKAPEAQVEKNKIEESQSSALPPKATIPEVTKTDKPGEVLADIPKSEAPKADAPKPDEAKLGAKTEVSMPDAPKPEIPKVDDSKPETPKVDASKAEAPKVDASKADSPKVDASKAEAPKVDASKPDAPKVDASKPDTPVTDVPKPETPKVDESKPEKSDIPKPETPKTEEPKPETPKPEVPQMDTSKIEAPATVAPLADTTKPSAPSADASKTDIIKPQTSDTSSQMQPTAPIPSPEAAKESNIQDSSLPKPVTPESDDKKQKTPPKDQKPAKQQAPQPPPKNGKQKKGQQPEPTAVHPLAEAPPIQGEPIPVKEDQKTMPLEPLTPPTSPDSTPALAPSAQQPGTPIVTTPTPPVTPLEASKIDDPLSAPLKPEESSQPGGASSSGPVDAPIPPKRKGKGNGQPQKQQGNGSKGKGKK